jgi:hypothetical protein
VTWKREQSADGLPVWSGQDSIFNVYASDNLPTLSFRAQTMGCIVWLALGMVTVVPLGVVIDLYEIDIPKIVDKETGQLIGTLLLAAWVSIAYVSGKRHYNHIAGDRFLGVHWSLTHKNSLFSYVGAEQWTVDLDQIARVEASPTTEWIKVRDYRGDGKEKSLGLIPAAEYQTFLVLRDTSRRVIYTANADREGCATLAHSIREYLESVRPAAAPAVATAPVAGFDL